MPDRGRPVRHRLPTEREGKLHRFVIDGHKVYLIVGCYPDGRPGEIFIRMAKEGSTVAGMVDAAAICISMLLQLGTPLEVIARKFIGGRFEPFGLTTGAKEIESATSVFDYVFRWMLLRYPTPAKDEAK